MRRVVSWSVVVAVASLAGLLGGYMLYERYESGEWKAPRGALVKIKRRLGIGGKAPRVIYLNRGPVTLTAGDDDSHRNQSSVVKRSGKPTVSFPAFRGSEKRWQSIVSCVRTTFRHFNIQFVTERPESGDYIMAVVGGKSSHLGAKTKHAGGLAPFSGDVIHGAVVFAFSDTLRNQKRAVCNTIAMEVGHAYGLDHLYNCRDVMTYLPDCGPKYFRDEDVPCGEHKARPCPDGAKSQNSYRTLERLVGLVGTR